MRKRPYLVQNRLEKSFCQPDTGIWVRKYFPISYRGKFHVIWSWTGDAQRRAVLSVYHYYGADLHVVIVQALVTWLDLPGRYVVILLLVFQLAASAGTFPGRTDSIMASGI